MANPALTVGGAPLYPMGGVLDPSRPVYRPEMGSSGLLSTDDWNNLVRDFAGGLLNGYQVGATPDQYGRYITPIAPSGMFSTDPGQTTTVTDNRDTPGSGITFRDALMFQYGDPNAYGNDQNVFRHNLLNNEVFRQNIEDTWGAKLDDPYDPSSEFWKNLLTHMGKMGNPWQGMGENNEGGQGTEGPGPGAGSGGAP